MKLGVLLVVVGAINWGVIGATGLIGDPVNLVEAILQGRETLINIVYLLVGLAALDGIQIIVK
jgi:uncharacterized membrane protein YuzA (DUF378 family)